MHRFLISAAHKSSGKTTISIGLAAALMALACYYLVEAPGMRLGQKRAD